MTLGLFAAQFMGRFSPFVCSHTTSPARSLATSYHRSMWRLQRSRVNGAVATGREEGSSPRLGEEGGVIMQQLSGAFPRETTTRCACGVAAGPWGES